MLNKAAIQVGGGSLQVYQKDGNNLHTEFVEEWIILEDQNLAKNTNYFWRLSNKDFTVRLVSLWANTTGTITLKLQNQGIDILSIPITNTQASNGYVFPALIVPSNFVLVLTCPQDIIKLFMTAKEVSVCENLSFSRQ